MNIKKIVKKVIGDKNLGRIDFFTKPEYKNVWGGAFNGQIHRRKIFDQLCINNDFKLIIETGSYRGNTTLLMAKKNILVLTVEYDPRIFGYVSTRFLFNLLIKTHNNDSRSFLKLLSADSNVVKENVFFYLDAHWSSDLPLAEELRVIFSNWSQFVIMIDDFQVPNTEYQFDDYGEGKALTLNYVAQALNGEQYSMYFPSVDESQESGFKRGCAIICNSKEVEKKLDLCDSLIRYDCSH